MTDSVGLGSQLGSYRIESVIGGGWMSAVYRARHVRLATTAAVKVLAPGIGQGEAGKRFLRDVNLAAELDHPNIVPILDAGMHGDERYVVMRLVAGGDLKTLISRAGALPPEIAAAILRPVADALDAAHRRWLVHGDVRPSNVLVEWSGDGAVERVYLTDFGMAGVVPMQVTSRSRDGTRADRFDYLAPEQSEHGGRATQLSDVFGLGCVLYHAITGRVPFGGPFGAAVPWGDEGDGPTRPSQARPELPAALDDAVLRAIAAEPGERFESCGDLVRAFEAALEPGTRVEDAELMLPETVFDGPSLVAAAPATPAPVEPAPPPFEWVEPAPPPFEWVDTPRAAPDVAAAAVEAPPPRAEPEQPAEPPSRIVDKGPAREPASRRRRHVAAAVIGVLTLLAAVGGYFAATANRGSDGGSSAGTAARADAAPAGPDLRTIATRDLADFKCDVTPGPAGGTVAETAVCSPKKAGRPPVRRVVLTRLTTRRALDQQYADNRALIEDPAARRPGECRPTGPWHGTGRWFTDRSGTKVGGRMFCATLAGGGGIKPEPRIDWTVDRSLVLAEAFAARSADLGAWWRGARNLNG